MLSSKEYGSTLESREQELVARSAASLSHSSTVGSADEAKEKEKLKMKVTSFFSFIILSIIIDNLLIQEQFEQYRKLKKQAEQDTVAVKKTSAEAKEYEEHLDDIRSLLTSINDVKIKDK